MEDTLRSVQKAPVNDGTIAIQLAMDAIKNNDLQEFITQLQKMPLGNLESFDLNSLLNRFLVLVSQFGRTKFVTPILDIFALDYPGTDRQSSHNFINYQQDSQSFLERVPLLVTLFLNPFFSVPVLRFVVFSLEDVTFIEIVEDLIDYDSGPSLPLACRRAVEVFGEQQRDVYQSLAQSADDKGNNEIYNFLITKLQETAPFSPVPLWVKNFTGGPIPIQSQLVIPQFKPSEFQVPYTNIDSVVDLLTEGMANQGLSFEDIEQAKSTLRGLFAVADTQTKIDLLRPIYDIRAAEDLQNNVELFRLLGPSNPIYDADLPLLQYGGYRMLQSNDFDYDEEFGYIVDWFTGFCQSCNLRIRYRWHALRMPLEFGGWKDCYCSFPCMRKSLNDDEIRQGRPNIVVRTMLDTIEQQLLHNGIQDRLPDPS